MRHKAVRLPDDLYAQLEQTAKAEDRTVSQVIRRILAAHYARPSPSPSTKGTP